MNTSGNQRIDKLREKADLNRHLHGELERRARLRRRWLYAVVQIIGVAVTAAAGAYFRVTAGESSETSTWANVLLLMVMVLPAVGTSLVILDATVFRFRDQEEGHKKAVRLWGDWIRRASEASEEGGDLRNGSDVARKLDKRYRKCMKETSNVPVSNKKFIAYKRDWIIKKNRSIELDRQKKWGKARHVEDNAEQLRG